MSGNDSWPIQFPIPSINHPPGRCPCPGAGCRFIYRWIPSEWNPWDGPSRGVRPDGTGWSQQPAQLEHMSTLIHASQDNSKSTSHNHSNKRQSANQSPTPFQYSNTCDHLFQKDDGNLAIEEPAVPHVDTLPREPR